jgi:hypothetical protein
MLPVILVAVGAYLIGDSVLGDKKSFAKGGMMAKGGMTFAVGQSIIYPTTNNSKLDKSVREQHNKYANKELVIEKIEVDNPYNTAKVFVRSTGEKVPFDLILNPNYVEQYAKGGKLVGKQKNLDVNKNGKLDAEDFKMLRGEKMAKGGKIGHSKLDQERFAKPAGWRWKDSAVTKKIISKADLSKSPSKAMRDKYPNYVYFENRLNKADVNPSRKYISE